MGRQSQAKLERRYLRALYESPAHRKAAEKMLEAGRADCDDHADHGKLNRMMKSALAQVQK